MSVLIFVVDFNHQMVQLPQIFLEPMGPGLLNFKNGTYPVFGAVPNDQGNDVLQVRRPHRRLPFKKNNNLSKIYFPILTFSVVYEKLIIVLLIELLCI